MHCPKCERVIPLFSAERLFAYWLARKCSDCNCKYKVHTPPLAIALLVVFAITASLFIGPSGFLGAFSLGIPIGLLGHIWSKLIPIEKT